MSILLIAVVIISYTAQSLTCKVYADSYPGSHSLSAPVFSVVSGFATALVTLAVAGFSFEPQPLTVLFAVLNAAVLTGYNYSLIGASQRGAYSILMVFSLSGGIIIPAIVGAFAFGDNLSIMQYVSVAVIIVSVWLVCRKKGELNCKNPAFWAFSALLCVCNGAYGALLDAQQRLTGTGDKEEMIIITFFLTALFSLVTLAVKRRGRLLSDFRQSKKSGLFLALCSLSVVFSINVLVYIIPLVNITVLYTFDNAGVLLLSVLCSRLFFKEKLSVMNVVGCALMCAGLMCMSLFKI